MGNKKNISYGYSPLLKKDPTKWRSYVMLGFLFLLLASLLFRAAYLQIFHKEFLQNKGEARYARILTIPSLRGKIFDRNGDILAMSSPVKSIWAIPEDANWTVQEEKELASLIGLTTTELKNRMMNKKNFVYLKRQVEPSLSKIIDEKKFPGIHLENTYKRYYPSGDILAHISGFTDMEEVGQEGIELFFNKKLTGVNGERKVLKNRRGQVIEEVGETIQSQNGSDVTLTIDNKIQFIVAKSLKEAIAKHKAKAGSAIVLDAKTGEVLSLVNYPTYNPNDRENLTGEKLRNRAITDIYEPGSTMKPFSIGLALEKNRVTPNTIFDTKSVVIGNKSIGDSHSYDQLSVSEIIQKSSNIGTVKVAMKLTPEEMWGLFNDVGFGQKVGIGFPGEAKGLLRPAKSWKPIEQATMAFGHGVSVSLLQMAHAYLALSNNGVIRSISLIKSDKDEVISKRIFSEKTAKQLQLMLESVTKTGGTATQAQTLSYRVAGKTGTANKLENGRYASKYVGSFIGFAPVSDPTLIVAVMIDEPSTNGYYGGVIAAPVFSKIVEESLNYLGVKPDLIIEEKGVVTEDIAYPKTSVKPVANSKHEVQKPIVVIKPTVSTKINTIEKTNALDKKIIDLNNKGIVKPKVVPKYDELDEFLKTNKF